MGYVLPWSLLMAYQIYTKGIQKNKLPEPYHFILPSVGIGVCAVIGMKDQRLGIALAWALTLSVAIMNQVGYKNPNSLSQIASGGTGVQTA